MTFPAFVHTVPCTRPASSSSTDEFGNTVGEDRDAIEFDAVFVPATSTHTFIVDGALRETTITKPTLFVEGRPDLRSGDPVEVDGETGWEVDGDPAAYTHPWTGWMPPLVVELRKSTG